MINEEWSMMQQINQELFPKHYDAVGLKDCHNCHKLMEWIDNKWVCNNCIEAKEK